MSIVVDRDGARSMLCPEVVASSAAAAAAPLAMGVS